MESDNSGACSQCPHCCDVDRVTVLGLCKANNQIKINTYLLHKGEEPVISGENGSGTIFFSHCNLKCVYCQNYKISDWGYGKYYSVDEVAEIMLSLQKNGAHNINLVSPTHYSLQIKEAIILAKEKGLDIPIVWNSNSYERVETLLQLEGLVDIYLADFKYWDDNNAIKYSAAPNYAEHAKKAILEMYRQVGNLKIDDDTGLAYRGLLIRLLVLPQNINGIQSVLNWISEEVGNMTYLSLMSQYYPTHRADEFPEINRPITRDEYDYAVHIMEGLGFENGFTQEMGITPEWTPNFKE
ncbi:MAG: radical SAM protein [Candidatus Cloacimonadales bacterium]|jgi:putative pyruvate formate lyase activating enzyme|nr:radical SAM protein [Candidatus Cloacimonadales bacterium]